MIFDIPSLNEKPPSGGGDKTYEDLFNEKYVELCPPSSTEKMVCFEDNFDKAFDHMATEIRKFRTNSVALQFQMKAMKEAMRNKMRKALVSSKTASSSVYNKRPTCATHTLLKQQLLEKGIVKTALWGFRKFLRDNGYKDSKMLKEPVFRILDDPCFKYITELRDIKGLVVSKFLDNNEIKYIENKEDVQKAFSSMRFTVEEGGRAACSRFLRKPTAKMNSANPNPTPTPPPPSAPTVEPVAPVAVPVAVVETQPVVVSQEVVDVVFKILNYNHSSYNTTTNVFRSTSFIKNMFAKGIVKRIKGWLAKNKLLDDPITNSNEMKAFLIKVLDNNHVNNMDDLRRVVNDILTAQDYNEIKTQDDLCAFLRKVINGEFTSKASQVKQRIVSYVQSWLVKH